MSSAALTLSDLQAEEEHFYPAPTGCSVHKSIFSLFEHYSSPSRSAVAPNAPEEKGALSMDGASFARMCRDCPSLGRRVGRTQVDLIFSKAKPSGGRRLGYEHFLDALLALATCVYADQEPIMALSLFLGRYIFALFDHKPCPDREDEQRVLQTVYDELNIAASQP